MNVLIWRKILFILFVVTIPSWCYGNVVVHWEDQYSNSKFTTLDQKISCLYHHVDQNSLISIDFINALINNGINGKSVDFIDVLRGARSIIEIGCGTGELLQEIAQKFNLSRCLGVDLSSNAIKYASQRNQNPAIKYLQFDCIKKSLVQELGCFDVAVCSNTLEHFQSPFVLLDAILECCDYCMILVPYKQKYLDPFVEEGGLGHVYSFDEHTFDRYTALSWFTFFSHGWVHYRFDEQPLQLAVLLKGKKQ